MEKDMDSGLHFFDPLANRANMLFFDNNKLIFPVQRTMMMNLEENNLTKKRTFFSSRDDMYYDEEYYYDEHLPEKKRRLTPEQAVLLEKSFDEENKLEPERKSELAKKLGLQPRQVAVWFQNRRARSKTKQLEKDFDVLKASYDALLSNYESVLKENDVLKSEVHSLNEKLQSKEEKVVGPRIDPTQVQVEDGRSIPSQRQLISKVEDMLSSGSGGSDVVNEENPHNMVDSGDSYFGCHLTYPYMAVVQSDREEDDISNDGQSYFSSMYTVAMKRQGQEEEDGQELGWWVWS